MDELWSFVDNKGNKQWVWIAIDAETREVIGLYIGDRSRKSAQALWDSLPPVYRQCAVCYTDFWDSYENVIPSQRHRHVNKQSGKTSYIERLNCTLRQRVSRLVRKALSFSNASCIRKTTFFLSITYSKRQYLHLSLFFHSHRKFLT